MTQQKGTLIHFDNYDFQIRDLWKQYCPPVKILKKEEKNEPDENHLGNAN